jgi:hypothetical protein
MAFSLTAMLADDACCPIRCCALGLAFEGVDMNTALTASAPFLPIVSAVTAGPPCARPEFPYLPGGSTTDTVPRGAGSSIERV